MGKDKIFTFTLIQISSVYNWKKVIIQTNIFLASQVQTKVVLNQHEVIPGRKEPGIWKVRLGGPMQVFPSIKLEIEKLTVFTLWRKYSSQ